MESSVEAWLSVVHYSIWVMWAIVTTVGKTSLPESYNEQLTSNLNSIFHFESYDMSQAYRGMFAFSYVFSNVMVAILVGGQCRRTQFWKGNSGSDVFPTITTVTKNRTKCKHRLVTYHKTWNGEFCWGMIISCSLSFSSIFSNSSYCGENITTWIL
jgi:hypothetical protein